MSFSLKKIFLKTIGRWIPSDYFAYRFPISIKGIFFIDDKVVLLKNERNIWDLPGGKLNKNEHFEVCLKREIREELNIEVEVDHFLSPLNIKVANKINVLVLVYLCTTKAHYSQLKISGESFDLKLFEEEDLENLQLPQAYRILIKKVMKNLTLSTKKI